MKNTSDNLSEVYDLAQFVQMYTQRGKFCFEMSFFDLSGVTAQFAYSLCEVRFIQSMLFCCGKASAFFK